MKILAIPYLLANVWHVLIQLGYQNVTIDKIEFIVLTIKSGISA